MPPIAPDSPQPLVTVIVPVLNGGDTIELCIQSLLQLQPPAGGIELIVVDNGSTDGTMEILQRYESRIKVLERSERGVSAARNFGVQHASGDRVAFIDSDCIAEPEWLRNLILPLDDLGVGIVGGAIRAQQPCNWIQNFGERIHDHQRAIEGEDPPYVIGMNWASRRAVLLEVGLFDERLWRGQDVDLARRIHAAGYRLVYSPSALVRHRNKDTIPSLFAEGMAHGRAIALVDRKYRSSSPSGIERTINLTGQIASATAGCLLGNTRAESVCATVFNAGKLIGMLRWRLATAFSRQAAEARTSVSDREL